MSAEENVEKGLRTILSQEKETESVHESKNSSDPFFFQLDLVDLADFKHQTLPNSSLRARVTPLDEHGNPAASWTVVVVELDERNIAFKHLVPLTARRVIVTFEKRGMSTYSVEVELTWCRFDHPHLYTSGGRFILPLGRTA